MGGFGCPWMFSLARLALNLSRVVASLIDAGKRFHSRNYARYEREFENLRAVLFGMKWDKGCLQGNLS